MRLNGAALNARGLNGSRRVPVTMAGSAVASVVLDLPATRTAVGAGSAALALSSALAPSARRYAGGSAPIELATGLAQTVARGGSGAARIAFSGALYFARTQYGSGELAVVLSARGDVGVKFGSGAAVIEPFELAIDGNRGRRGAGTAVVEVLGDFPASAIRVPLLSSATMVAAITADLEPSHIDGGGVRHIGMFGDLPIAWSLVDAGMLRQAHIGDMEIAFVTGAATGTVHRPTLSGSAVSKVLLEAAFQTQRRGQGAAAITALAQCDGAIFVRGSSAAPISVTSQLSAQLTRKLKIGDALLGILAAGDFTRLRSGGGSAVISIGLAGIGTRVRRLSGPLVIEALSWGEAVTNPDAEDIDRQQFVRPASTRSLARPAMQREFRR